MDAGPSRSTPSLNPFGPVRLALLAIAIPSLSLTLALSASIILMQALGFGTAGEIVTLLGRSDDAGGTIEVVLQAWGLLFEGLLLALTVAICVQRERPSTAGLIGWRAWQKNRSFLPFLGLVLAWQAIEGFFILPRFPEFSDLGGLPQSQLALLVSLLTVVVVAPIAEEVFFRGFIYTSLRAHAGFAATIILTAALDAVYFAVLHNDGGPVLALLMLPFGLVLGLAREHFGSVRPAIYLHLIWNLVAWGSEYFQTAAR